MATLPRNYHKGVGQRPLPPIEMKASCLLGDDIKEYILCLYIVVRRLVLIASSSPLESSRFCCSDVYDVHDAHFAGWAPSDVRAMPVSQHAGAATECHRVQLLPRCSVACAKATRRAHMHARTRVTCGGNRECDACDSRPCHGTPSCPTRRAPDSLLEE